MFCFPHPTEEWTGLLVKIYLCFNQWTRLGDYKLTGESDDGRAIYTQDNGQNYIYFLVSAKLHNK